MTHRRIVLTRPSNIRRGVSGGPFPTGSEIQLNLTAFAHTHTRAQADTTTNVVSVSAPRARTCTDVHTRTHARTSTREPIPKKPLQTDSVLDQVRALSTADRKLLLDQLLLDRNTTSGGKSQVRDVAMWAASVHQALEKAVGASGGELVGQAVVAKWLGSGTVWKPVADFMQSSKLHELAVADRQQVYNMLATLLVAHAREVSRRSGAPLSVKLVGQCTGNLPGVFESSFPGYLENGLAKMVARAACHA